MIAIDKCTTVTMSKLNYNARSELFDFISKSITLRFLLICGRYRFA